MDTFKVDVWCGGGFCGGVSLNFYNNGQEVTDEYVRPGSYPMVLEKMNFFRDGPRIRNFLYGMLGDHGVPREQVYIRFK